MRHTLLAPALICLLSAPTFAEPPATRPVEPRVTYDKFKDETQVIVGPMELRLDKGKGPQFLTAVTSFSGTKPGGKRGDILLSLAAPKGTYGERPTLRFLANGRNRFECPLVVRDVAGDDEALSFLISRDDLGRMAHAGKVEGQVEGTEFALTDEQVAALLKFMAAFEKPK